MTFTDGVWAYLFLLLAGLGATQPWRLLGVLLSRNLNTDSELLIWVRFVSTALIAGLVARMVAFPAGALAATALELRLAAFGVGIAVFLALSRNLGAGIFAGIAVLVLTQYATTPGG